VERQGEQAAILGLPERNFTVDGIPYNLVPPLSSHPEPDLDPPAARAADAPMPLADAASRLLADLREGAEPDARALTIVLLQLRRHVARLFPEIDADDVVQSTMIRLLRRSEGLETEVENAWGYLLGATRNSAIDAIRAHKRRREVHVEALADDAPSADDAIAALIDRHATHARVLAAMRAAIDAGDEITIPIITKWLDIADELGKAPSTREVASRAGVSHTTVAQALKRFRALLEPDVAEPASGTRNPKKNEG
jgi:RNA polymerase sigma factor (sigma-70 family)